MNRLRLRNKVEKSRINVMTLENKWIVFSRKNKEVQLKNNSYRWL